MRKLLFTLPALLLLIACTKNTALPTQAQLTATKLVQLFGSTSGNLGNGTVVYVVDNTGHIINTATPFNISSDGYIILWTSGQDPVTYNLDYLTRYSRYSYGTNNFELDFSF